MDRVRVGVKKKIKVAKVAKMQIREERIHGRRAVARKEAKGKRKVAREKTKHVGLVAKQGHIAAWCRKGDSKILYAIDEDDGEDIEETPDNDEEL